MNILSFRVVWATTISMGYDASHQSHKHHQRMLQCYLVRVPETLFRRCSGYSAENSSQPQLWVWWKVPFAVSQKFWFTGHLMLIGTIETGKLDYIAIVKTIEYWHLCLSDMTDCIGMHKNPLLHAVWAQPTSYKSPCQIWREQFDKKLDLKKMTIHSITAYNPEVVCRFIWTFTARISWFLLSFVRFILPLSSIISLWMYR